MSGLFITAFNPVSAAELVENIWNTKKPMTQARAGLGVIAVDGKIYAIGGSKDDLENAMFNTYKSGHVGTNECYDPVSNTWSTLEPMPTPRSNFAITAYQGKIYCIGGIIGWTTLDYWPFQRFIMCDAVEVYDTVSGAWSTKTFMPEDIKPFNTVDISACVVGGKIFVILQYQLFMYDPDADTWTKRAQLPLSHGYYDSFYEPVSVVVDGKLVVTSAIPDPDFRGTLFYDPKVDVWSKSEIRCRIPYFGDAGVTTGLYAPKKIYVLGMLNEYGDNRVYDPLNDSWSDGKSMLTPRLGFGVAVVDDVLYAIGGRTENQAASAVNEQYIPIGYKGVIPTPEPSNSLTTSESGSSKHPSAYLIVTILTVIIVKVVTGLFLYFKKRKISGV